MQVAHDWYETAVVYAVDVETFYDGNGDGVGDFRGLTDRLDYVSRLGVDCLWLLPFYPTPNRDNGYDISDYYSVDPRLGTLGDFATFVDAANERGIRVIADLVVNHTSNEHPWFRAARADPDSPYRDYYIWTDEPSTASAEGLAFPGEEEHVWTYDEVAGASYYHRFYRFQPDLNTGNPTVRAEIGRILRFWLDLGVAGFRVDAATSLIEREATAPTTIEEPHELFRWMKRVVRSIRSDAVLLAEADDDPEHLGDYFGAGDEMDLLLNFVLNAHLIRALAIERATPLVEGLRRLPDVRGRGRWGNFLRNYDEVNLGRLSEADREEIYAELAPEGGMRIYGRGIRRRLGPMLGGDDDRIALAHSLLFSLPGMSILVAGDEIGMGEDLSLPGRLAVRTPMQWAGTPNAGFSTAPSTELVRPVVSEGPFAYERVNVDDQRPEPESLLNRVSRLIRTRQEFPVLAVGEHTVLDPADECVFAHRSDGDGSAVVAVHNLSAEPRTVELNLCADDRPIAVVGDADCSPVDESHRIGLGRYAYCWFRVDT